MVTKIEADYKQAVLTERSPKIVLARVNMRETEDTDASHQQQGQADLRAARRCLSELKH